MSALPLRLRVALAFTAATAVLLTVLGAFLYVAVEDTLLDRTRTGLTSQLDALSAVPPAHRLGVLEALTPAFGQVVDTGGHVLVSSPVVSGPILAPDELPTGSATTESDIGVHLAGQSEPERTIVLARSVGDQVLVVGTSREDVADDLQVVLVRLLVGGVVGLALAAALGYVIAGTALRPIERMRRRAEVISAQRSSERLPVPDTDDELRRLGVTLNEMLDRLDAGLQRERRFVAEAGHELRTPLAMLRMELDLALSHERSTDELVAAIESAGEEAERLAGLAEDLLLLASTETSQPVADVELAPLVERVLRRCAVGAAGRTLSSRVPQDTVVHGNADRLGRAVANLVDNAVRHGQGEVAVAAEGRDGFVRLTIADQGSAWSAQSGLGLAIVKAIVEEHGGRLEVATDTTSSVTAVLPDARRLRGVRASPYPSGDEPSRHSGL